MRWRGVPDPAGAVVLIGCSPLSGNPVDGAVINPGQCVLQACGKRDNQPSAASLEVFEPYTSHRLRWFPFELTRCLNLRDSTVSTRSIFGNFKYRPPFPVLRQGPLPLGGLDPGIWGADSISSCSVCGGPITGRGVRQAWLSVRVATDVLPLLVNACSEACVQALPPGAERHVLVPHSGGRGVVQPEAYYSPRPSI